MKVADLWSLHPKEELCRFENDSDLLYQAMTPYLTHLHEDMIIYREKNILLCKLTEIDLNEIRFGACAEVVSMVMQRTSAWPDSWEFGCTWKWYRLSGSWLATNPYVGYQVMVDPDVVAKVQWLMQKGDAEQAMKLINDREQLGSSLEEEAVAAVLNPNRHTFHKGTIGDI